MPTQTTGNLAAPAELFIANWSCTNTTKEIMGFVGDVTAVRSNILLNLNKYLIFEKAA